MLQERCRDGQGCAPGALQEREDTGQLREMVQPRNRLCVFSCCCDKILTKHRKEERVYFSLAVQRTSHQVEETQELEAACCTHRTKAEGQMLTPRFLHFIRRRIP